MEVRIDDETHPAPARSPAHAPACPRGGSVERARELISDVPRYLVEAYSSGSEQALNDARERASAAAELGVGIRSLRTTFLPADEVVLHLFDAPSAAALDGAAKRAGLQFERIVEAVEGPVSAPRAATAAMEEP